MGVRYVDMLGVSPVEDPQNTHTSGKGNKRGRLGNDHKEHAEHGKHSTVAHLLLW